MSENLISEIWQRRSQIWVFAVNDVRIRYRNSALGFLWTFLEPLLMLTVLYLVFTNIFKSNIEHYSLYILLSLIIWYMFTRGTGMGITSLIDKSSIVTKVYFRREIIVVSSNLTAFIMMSFEFIIFGIFIGIFQFTPSLTIIYFPLVMVDLFLLTLGISMFLSILNVKFRDIQLIWQVIIQAGFFLSPIIYRLDMFPENIRKILELNPMATLLTISQDLVLYDLLPSIESVLYLTGFTIGILVLGLIVFKKMGNKIIEEL